MNINKEQAIGITILHEDDSEFSYSGCENCANRLGNDVFDCEITTEQDKYSVNLCHQCLCAYYNGDELDDNCQNVFGI